MDRARRWVIGGLGSASLIFGLLCIHYTKQSSREHHRQFASEHGLPGPSDTIFIGGIVCAAFGAGLVGLAWRRREVDVDQDDA